MTFDLDQLIWVSSQYNRKRTDTCTCKKPWTKDLSFTAYQCTVHGNFLQIKCQIISNNLNQQSTKQGINSPYVPSYLRF